MINTIFKDGLFKGKVALITGGGTGIGLRIARELGQLGATIVIASRSEDKLLAGLKTLQDDGSIAEMVVCNIRDEESVKSCITSIVSKHQQLDILVNNGGGQFPSPAEFFNRKGWHAVIETNLTGTFFLTQEAFNQSMRDNGGAIVNITMDNRNGFPMLSHSAAARAGIQNLTMSLANEWGKYGVRINSVAPGTIESSGLDSYAPQFQDFVRSYGKHNQTYRLGTEAEIAAAVVFLLSPGASFINGLNMAVDGGESIYTPLMPPTENERHEKFDDE